MGEKETSGMLRNVVVLGLIALIAAVIVALVVGLKTKMVDHADEATPPTMIVSLLNPDEFKMKRQSGPGNFNNDVPASAFSWSDSGTELHLDTTGLPDQTWIMAQSKWDKIPADTKRVKLEVTLKGHGSTYTHPWIHMLTADNVDKGSGTLNTIGANAPATKYQTYSTTLKVPEDVTQFYVSLETREGMIVDYKDASVTFYNH